MKMKKSIVTTATATEFEQLLNAARKASVAAYLKYRRARKFRKAMQTAFLKHTD
jgi:hypothetical protein